MMLVRNCLSSSNVDAGATECIDRIRSDLSESAFGFKVQALAGHVLLRLGYQIVEINSSGHPDIVARRDGKTFCFEVEAEVSAPRLRKLTDADFASLMNASGVTGYYALAIRVPKPRWVVVPAAKLSRRVRGSPKALLEAHQRQSAVCGMDIRIRKVALYRVPTNQAGVVQRIARKSTGRP